MEKEQTLVKLNPVKTGLKAFIDGEAKHNDLGL